MRNLRPVTAVYQEVRSRQALVQEVEAVLASFGSAMRPLDASKDGEGADLGAEHGKAAMGEAEVRAAIGVESMEVMGRLMKVRHQLDAVLVGVSEGVVDAYLGPALEDEHYKAQLRGEQMADAGVLEEVAERAWDAATHLALQELMCVSGVGRYMAGQLVQVAQGLGELPATGELFNQGVVGLSGVDQVCRSAQGLSPETLIRFDEEVSRFLVEGHEHGVTRTKGAVRKKANELRAVLCPQACEMGRRRALAERGVWIENQPDGVALLSALLAAEDALAISNTLTDIAFTVKKAADPRTLMQLKADALVQLFLTNTGEIFPVRATPVTQDAPVAQDGSIPRDPVITAPVQGRLVQGSAQSVQHKRNKRPGIRAADGLEFGGSEDGGIAGSDAVMNFSQFALEVQEGSSEPHLRGEHPLGAGSPPSEIERMDEVVDADIGDVLGTEWLEPFPLPDIPPDYGLARKVLRDDRRKDAEEKESMHPHLDLPQTGNERVGKAGAGAVVKVYLSVGALVGVDESPGVVAGYGVVPASVVRRLAARADTLYRMVVDPVSGKPLGQGRRAYRVSEQTREYLMMLSETCEFPGCDVSSRRADADHVQPWDQGGLTDPVNLQLVCRTHHNLKTKHGWVVSRGADGTTSWTSPLGNTYTNEKQPLLPSPASSSTPYGQEPTVPRRSGQ